MYKNERISSIEETNYLGSNTGSLRKISIWISSRLSCMRFKSTVYDQ